MSFISGDVSALLKPSDMGLGISKQLGDGDMVNLESSLKSVTNGMDTGSKKIVAIDSGR